MKGRATGIAGNINGVLVGDRVNFHWRLAMILSMLIVSSFFYLYTPIGKWFSSYKVVTLGLSTFGFIFAGLFVGFGTKLANGGLSGHLFCGVPSLNRRSLAAVLTFLIAAIATATIKYNIFEDNERSSLGQPFDK
jgi:uncharacterized membrane protein YedE/YeeE